MRSGLLTILAVALFLPTAALAQALGETGGVGGSPLSLSVTPQYPSPYSQVSVSVTSTSVDLSNSTMSASVGGKNVYQGSVQPFAVTLGKTGSLTTVAVTVSSGSAKYSETVSIQPQDVVLVAEPISSSPPLYPGKPSVPIEGSVRVVAIADLRSSGGKTSNPSSYAYSWTVDGTQIGGSSGIGKNTIIVASPLQYRGRTVSVSVQSSDGLLAGGANLFFSPEEPTVRLYRNDPLLGILYDRALAGTYTITGQEATLYAAPFSFATTRGAPSLRWFLNGAPAQTGHSITLRPSGTGQGRASLSVVASTGQYVAATANLPLSFGGSSGTNFFGL